MRDIEYALCSTCRGVSVTNTKGYYPECILAGCGLDPVNIYHFNLVKTGHVLTLLFIVQTVLVMHPLHQMDLSIVTFQMFLRRLGNIGIRSSALVLLALTEFRPERLYFLLQ